MHKNMVSGTQNLRRKKAESPFASAISIVNDIDTNDKGTSHLAMVALSVLILSPDPAVLGGVTVFIEMMKTYLKHCQVTSCWVGSRQNHKENMVGMAMRLIGTPIKVAWLAYRRKFDVIHINPTLDFKSMLRDGLILFMLRLIRFRRILVYFHGWEFDFEHRIRQKPALQSFLVWLLNGTDRILVLAPEFQQSLIEMGVDSKRIIYTRTMFDGESLKAAQTNLLTSKRRSILYMSRFVREKGVYELLDAFARVAAEFPDVDLIMAGEGTESKGLRLKATTHGLGERVKFPGYIVGMEKYKMLCDCTLFALPTYAGEGMPVALLEAMGAGKPLLTAKAGVIPHIITDPDNGVVLDSVTTATVEAALRRLLSNKDYCDETGQHNTVYAWNRFEAKSVTAEIEALYNDIARH